jgi:hypothetical protein
LYGAAASLKVGGRIDASGYAVVIRLPFRPAPVSHASDTELEALRA